MTDLRATVQQAVAELDAAHRPQWARPELEARGFDPVGCVICWPSDGHWPCTSRMIADDLREAVHPGPPEPPPAP